MVKYVGHYTGLEGVTMTTVTMVNHRNYCYIAYIGKGSLRVISLAR
jgi:hypothetical protein